MGTFVLFQNLRVNVQIRIESVAKDNCASYWLLFGFICRPDGFAEAQDLGFDNGITSGYVMRVSDEPCVGSVCPGVVCEINGHMGSKSQDATHRIATCDPPIHGKYVSVQLPGPNRVHGLVISKVYTAEPDTVAAEPYVCYGIEAIDATETNPEYRISSDPEDPAFYSTCYERETEHIWIEVDAQPVVPPWRSVLCYCCFVLCSCVCVLG